MTTKTEIRNLVYAKYGKGARLEHNAKALSKAQKDLVRLEYKDKQDRCKLLKEECEELESQGDPRKALRDAARFAIDVDGDEPSWSQLREALEREERYAAITQEIADLNQWFRGNHGLHSWAWKIVKVDRGGPIPISIVHESADSLEELAAKLR